MTVLFILSIPSRIIIKNGRLRGIWWFVTFNSIKDYLFECFISAVTIVSCISIPSRIISEKDKIKSQMKIMAFNSIKDYQVLGHFSAPDFTLVKLSIPSRIIRNWIFTGVWDAGTFFQFHQGLSNHEMSWNQFPILDFQFHQGLSWRVFRVLRFFTRSSFNSIKDYHGLEASSCRSYSSNNLSIPSRIINSLNPSSLRAR